VFGKTNAAEAYRPRYEAFEAGAMTRSFLPH
jgi:hypothetical protein